MDTDIRVRRKRTSSRASALLGPFALAGFIAVSHALLGQESGRETAKYRVLEPRAGEICIVCDKAIGPKDRVYEFEGQRVPVHVGACDTAFLRNPGHYLARLKPRGAFLSAEPNLAPHVGWGWCAFGIYVLLG